MGRLQALLSRRNCITFKEIEIERRQSSSGAQFYLVGRGNVGINTTLAQKLKTEYQLQLPEYDGEGVEEYFSAIAKLTPNTNIMNLIFRACVSFWYELIN